MGLFSRRYGRDIKFKKKGFNLAVRHPQINSNLKKATPAKAIIRGELITS